MAIETNQSQLAAKPADCPVILHVSDLHFGYNENTQTKDDRTKALGCLADRVTALDREWHPEYICITGDVGYYGAAADYEIAEKWLLSFLDKLSVAKKSVFICPGNHDVDWEIAKKHARPQSADEADETLSRPLSSHFDEIFANYLAFQVRLGLSKYSLTNDGSEESYLYGVQTRQDGLRFICCNSCWYSKDEDDKGKLWIGAPLLRSLDSRGLICRRSDSQTIDIALIHHPKDWLADSESRTRGGRRVATFDYLAREAHVVLTGHTHDDLRLWDQNENEAYVCGGGASWASISHPHTFRLIQIDRESEIFHYRSFQWDASQLEWNEVLLNKPNSRFFQNKLERALSVACQSQSTPSGAVASIQQMEPATGMKELLYESQIEGAMNIPSGSVRPSLLLDKSLEADKIVKELIDKMRRYSTRGDYGKALACWETNSDWFSEKKTQVDAALAEELELLVEEITLYREQA